MKKIMFENNRFGLEDEVLKGRKTMTRRTLRLPGDLKPQDVWNPVMGIDERGKVYFTMDCIDAKQRDFYPQYQVGEVVAVAQAYGSFLKMYQEPQADLDGDYNNMHWPAAVCRAVNNHKGWSNKMYVRANLMPHRVRITNIKLERLQDISDDDCRKEGVIPLTWRQWHKQEWDDLSPQKYTDHDVWTLEKFREGIEDSWSESEPDEFMAETPQVAFAVLIFKLMSRKAWDENPWTWAYEFELAQ